jgi:PPOX class probable F420-dependent enzyme
MTDPQTLLALGDGRFIRLTTFRRSGEPVGTPVWVVREGDELLVFTPSGSGKLKRLRHTSRVEVTPCSRRGEVQEGAVPLEAVGRIDPSEGSVERVRNLLKRKYGLEFRIFMLVEAVLSRGSRDRTIVRISAS